MADDSLTGRDLGTMTFPVDRSKVREFARSLGDPDPVYADALEAFEALCERRPGILELQQMSAVIRIQQFGRQQAPDGAAVLELLQDVERLAAVSSGFRFLESFTDRLLRKIGPRIKDPPPQLKRRLDALGS